MKKILGLLVAGLTLSALMAGCGQAQEGDTANAPTPENAPAPGAPAAPGTTDGAAAPTTGG